MPSARAVAIAAFISAATSPSDNRVADVVSTGSSSDIGANPSPVMGFWAQTLGIWVFDSPEKLRIGLGRIARLIA